ncbi:MAG: right-handed parallel beta-helix repeat-containing protein [Phycisphaerae bacterium]|nr:right-handed parallel beta-helix repeat-containing protein [Phycisphaerae bacterium]
MSNRIAKRLGNGYLLVMRPKSIWLVGVALLCTTSSGWAKEWYVSTGGKVDGDGSVKRAWDLASALGGRKEIRPGDTVWIGGGTYKFGDRKLGSAGYEVKLVGAKGKPIVVRGVAGKRVTIDGGLSVRAPSDYLWIRDLEIVVSENLPGGPSRVLSEGGSHPKSYARPWGGLNVYTGRECKFINLVIHDNAQGISWWKGSTDSEVYGCIVYDNGWKGPDRGHGHAIYTQNAEGVKTISDCIMTGGYGQTMHAYGSKRAWVDNYFITGNIAYAGARFLVGGGRPSKGIRVTENMLHGVSMQIGYNAPHNEDCLVRDNVIIDGALSIVRYKKVVRSGNLVVAPPAPRPADAPGRVIVRGNKYDANRAHVAIFNWAQKDSVLVKAGPVRDIQPKTPKGARTYLRQFLKRGSPYRLMDPQNFYGKPLLKGTYDGKAIKVPMKGRKFAAFVLIRRV